MADRAYPELTTMRFGARSGTGAGDRVAVALRGSGVIETGHRHAWGPAGCPHPQVAEIGRHPRNTTPWKIALVKPRLDEK
jgi:hypothetical protein